MDDAAGTKLRADMRRPWHHRRGRMGRTCFGRRGTAMADIGTERRPTAIMIADVVG
jgi:hypothetical protein